MSATQDSGAAVGTFVAIWLVSFLVCGFIGYAVANSKGRGGAGFALGFFLGPIGIVVAAVLSPSAEVQAGRDRQLARSFAEATGMAGPGTGTGSTGRASGDDPSRPTVSAMPSFRQQALAMAVEQDVSLGSATSAEELSRLRQVTAEIEEGLALKWELEQMAIRNADDERALVAEQHRVTAAAAAAQLALARADQKRAAAEAKAAQIKAANEAEAARLAAMNPVRRWATTHKGLTGVTAGLVVLALIAAVAIPANTAFARATAQAQATASAAAAAEAKVAAAQAAAEVKAAAAQAAAHAAIAKKALCRRAPFEKDLHGLNLTSCNLGGASWSHANLSRANLTDVNLFESNLTKANLSGANLHGTDLQGANLSGANLRRANLTQASMSGANLRGANLSGAIFHNTVCPNDTNSNAQAPESCAGQGGGL